MRNPSNFSESDIESIRRSITDNEYINQESHRYACTIMCIVHDSNPEKMDLIEQKTYWELYSARTRELVIHALSTI